MSGLAMLGPIVSYRSLLTLADVTPIARLISEYEVVVVPAASPYRTLADLTRSLRDHPESVSWAGGPAGGNEQMLAWLIADAVGWRSETYQLHPVLRQRRSQPRDPRQPGLAWHQSARLDRRPHQGRHGACPGDFERRAVTVARRSDASRAGHQSRVRNLEVGGRSAWRVGRRTPAARGRPGNDDAIPGVARHARALRLERSIPERARIRPFR